MGGKLGKRFFMPFMRSAGLESLKPENSSGLSSNGLEKAIALAKAKKLSFWPPRLVWGSGSVGKVTLGLTKGVIVSEDEAEEAVESGLSGLKVSKLGGGFSLFEAVIVSSEGGIGAWGNGGVLGSSTSVEDALFWHFFDVMWDE